MFSYELEQINFSGCMCRDMSNRKTDKKRLKKERHLIVSWRRRSRDKMVQMWCSGLLQKPKTHPLLCGHPIPSLATSHFPRWLPTSEYYTPIQKHKAREAEKDFYLPSSYFPLTMKRLFFPQNNPADCSFYTVSQKLVTWPPLYARVWQSEDLAYPFS